MLVSPVHFKNKFSCACGFFFFIELTCPSGGCLFAAINFFNLMAHGNGVVTLSILGGRTTKTLGLGQQREAENWHT